MILEYSSKNGKISFSSIDLLSVSSEVIIGHTPIRIGPYDEKTFNYREFWEAHYVLTLFAREPLTVEIYLGDTETTENEYPSSYSDKLRAFKEEHSKILEVLKNRNENIRAI